MSTTLRDIPTTYVEANRLLGSETWRTIANNTLLVRHRPGLIGLVLHLTEVVIFADDGAITLHTGGWRTVTTKDRINRVLRAHGGRVFAKGGQWYLEHPNYNDGQPVVFEEGVTILPRRSGRPELVGTHCECGGAYDPALPGYACAR